MAKTKFEEKYTWHTIMEMYHSSDKYLNQKACEWAIENLKGFVIFCAEKVYKSYMPRYGEDIIQSGYLGVLEGLKNFDETKVLPTTYFKYFIKGAMQQYVDTYVETTTTHYGHVYRKVNQAINFFEQNEKKWDFEIIADYLGMPVVSVKTAYYIKKSRDELDTSGNLGDINECLSIYYPIDDKEDNEARTELLENCFSVLTKEEVYIIKSLYGWSTDIMSYHDVAVELGYTTNKLKKIEFEILNKMRGIISCPGRVTKSACDKIKDDYFFTDCIDSKVSVETIEDFTDSFLPHA